MQVVKATKRFRQVSLIGSLLLSIGSVCVLIFDRKTCESV